MVEFNHCEYKETMTLQSHLDFINRKYLVQMSLLQIMN